MAALIENDHERAVIEAIRAIHRCGVKLKKIAAARGRNSHGNPFQCAAPHCQDTPPELHAMALPIQNSESRTAVEVTGSGSLISVVRGDQDVPSCLAMWLAS